MADDSERRKRLYEVQFPPMTLLAHADSERELLREMKALIRRYHLNLRGERVRVFLSRNTHQTSEQKGSSPLR